MKNEKWQTENGKSLAVGLESGAKFCKVAP
jgi:hypothetical protein